MDKLSKKAFYPAEGKRPNIKAVWTGEKRCPRCGEWYLSGASIMAYMAHNDLTSVYPIAKLVEVETVQIIRVKGAK